jgi:predicted XRE-type DNA-binding protein
MPTPDPIPLLKEQLAREIVLRVDGWTQDLAASLLGTDPPRLSDLRRGRLDRFSLQRLIRLISHDHGTVTVQVTWASRWQKLRDQRDERNQRRAALRTPRTPRPGATPSTTR